MVKITNVLSMNQLKKSVVLQSFMVDPFLKINSIQQKINGLQKIAPNRFPGFAMINEGDDYSTAGNGSSDSGSVIYSMGLK
jgi:hypothetical protein